MSFPLGPQLLLKLHAGEAGLETPGNSVSALHLAAEHVPKFYCVVTGEEALVYLHLKHCLCKQPFIVKCLYSFHLLHVQGCYLPRIIVYYN